MAQWHQWASFDIIGDLIFAESFGCLDQEEWPLFMRGLVGSQGMVLVVLNYIGMLWVTQLLCVVVIKRLLFNVQSALVEKVHRRISAKVEIEDLFEGLMRYRKEGVRIESSLRFSLSDFAEAEFRNSTTVN